MWEPWEIQALANKLRRPLHRQGRSGPRADSSTATTAARPASTGPAGPGDPPEKIMAGVSMPGADPCYFPGGGNSVTFITPGGIDGIAGRLAYSGLSGMFSLVWDEAATVDMPAKLAKAVAEHHPRPTGRTPGSCPSTPAMAEYKQYAPANHFHMTLEPGPCPAAVLDGPGQRAIGHALVRAVRLARRHRSSPAPAPPAQRRRGPREVAACRGTIGEHVGAAVILPAPNLPRFQGWLYNCHPNEGEPE